MTAKTARTTVSPALAGRPLLVTADPALLDDLLRLAATAGTEAELAAHPQAARPSWATAPLVLVGEDLADRIIELGLPRRPDVILVAPAGRTDDTTVWRRAVDLGAARVVLLPEGEPWLVERLAWSDRADAGGQVIAVVGGRGGAGASSLVAALCLAAVRGGLKPLLLDADPWGAGADLLLGAESEPGLRWPDLAGLSGQVSGDALNDALPQPLGVSVVSWDRGTPLDLPTSAVVSVLEAAVRSHDLVVVDLPRRADATSSAVLARTTATYVIVPAEVRAAAAAARTLAWLKPGGSAAAVVRTGRGRSLDPVTVAAALGLPLAGVVRDEPHLESAVDAGDAPGLRPRSPLARLADALLCQLAPRRSPTSDSGLVRSTGSGQASPPDETGVQGGSRFHDEVA
jgi:secretion/DNA translocation related CpaE-like protein